MSGQTRPYRKQRRAELEAETRLRITESAVALHGTLGPAKTSISAIAEHAGVRRSTVYRHFADEEAIVAACSAHWAAANPPPDPTPWAGIADPDERLRTALTELYAYYERTEQMLANLIRDEDDVPAIKASFAAYHLYVQHVRDLLMAGRNARGRAATRTRAAIGHALGFAAWRSLVREQGLGRADAVDVMSRIASGTAHAQERR